MSRKSKKILYPNVVIGQYRKYTHMIGWETRREIKKEIDEKI